jgi:segregation and condensation protein A
MGTSADPGSLAVAELAAGPAVRFGAGRRPEDATEVVLEDWSGPLGLLLTLIEARRLDVLTVPLGALAGAYLEALAALDGDRIANVSSFVAVASQLILIKSRAMLPRRADPGEPDALPDEGPDPEAELRERLLLYRAYRDAGLALQATALARVGLYRREPSVAAAAALSGARAPEAPPLDPSVLVAALEGIAAVMAPPEPPPEIIRRTVTLTERAAIIRRALRDAPVIVLQDLLAGVRDRVVVAVTFLAMLELVKRREIVVEQASPFGPITARRSSGPTRGPGRRSEPDALPTADDDPLDESLDGFR